MKGNRMKIRSKIPFLSIGFGTVVFLGFAATISGSLAWWAYSTRISVSYQGTSVASAEQLQIGLKSNDSGLAAYGMSNTDTPGYYFSTSGSGLQADVITYYLTHCGTNYATNKLEPVTSGSYTIGDTLSLKNSLVSGNIYNDHAADVNRYVKIPLAFRILKYDNTNTQVYSKGQDIYLNAANAAASGSHAVNNVYKALRIYTSGMHVVENEGVKSLEPVKTIINPSDPAQTETGQTAVAGLLDLNGSGFYDTYERDGKSYNIVYGQTNLANEAAVLATETVQQDPANSSAELVNFNGTQALYAEGDTFTAKYYKGTYHPENLAAISPKYQQYDTMHHIRPTDNDGILSSGKPIAATDLTTGIADLELTIWLEGWDHNVVDQENQHSFNLDLQFQITRL